MTSSPPATDTHINPSGAASDALINPSAPILPIDPLAFLHNARPSSQTPFTRYPTSGITPGWITLGTNLSYYAPLHHTSRSIPSIPFPNLPGTPITPNLNTVTETNNQPPTNKEAMIQNLQAQMALVQQQLNVLIQDNNPGITRLTDNVVTP